MYLHFSIHTNLKLIFKDFCQGKSPADRMEILFFERMSSTVNLKNKDRIICNKSMPYILECEILTEEVTELLASAELA